MTIQAAPAHEAGEDRFSLAFGMTLAALAFSLAINVRDGMYSPWALIWLSVGMIVSLFSVVIHLGPRVDSYVGKSLTVLLFFAGAIQAGLLLYNIRGDPMIASRICLVAIIGLSQAINLRAIRIPFILLMVVAFCGIEMFVFSNRVPDPNIDVFEFQQDSSDALMHGHDPYAIHFKSIYPPNTPFYGPNVVDANGWIQYGFPYMPLSLLMVLPGYAIGNDVRYAHTVALGISALLIALARPGRRAPLAALLVLMDPKGMLVLNLAWTEPTLVLTFSLAMFCAIKWRKGLPWALGLFFATKQYTILAVPAVFLLCDGPKPIRQFIVMGIKAGIVAAAITVPFMVWNFHEFWRAVVQWQLVQPFRTDALSYLVWFFNHNGGKRPPIYTPFLVVIPAMIIAIWRCGRTPAGFAAGITLIFATFFAFNKQAFCNYYYFVVATACWSVAATGYMAVARKREPAFEVVSKAHVSLPSGR